MALARRHGLMPLAFGHVLGRFADAVPEQHRALMREEFTHNAARNVWLTAELCQVLGAFEREGVPAVPYKGPVLAAQAYGDLKLRSFVDLDVLVRKDDMARAGPILSALGYRPRLNLTAAQEEALFRSECDRVYLKEGRNVVLEVHWAVVPPYYGLPIEADDVLADLRRAELGGAQVGIPAPETMVLLLCVNGTKDLWARLEQVSALSELLRGSPGLDWEKVTRAAARLNFTRALLVGLSLAHGLLGAPLPGEILEMAAADGAVRRLADEVTRRLQAADGREPGLAEATRFRLAAMSRWRDRLRYCAARSLTPTYRDAAAGLPPSLSLLYYGLRPLRLIRAGLARRAARPRPSA